MEHDAVNGNETIPDGRGNFLSGAHLSSRGFLMNMPLSCEKLVTNELSKILRLARDNLLPCSLKTWNTIIVKLFTF